MSFALLFIGVIMIVAAVRDTVTELIALLKMDFSGKGNFLYWIVALVAVGAVGYTPKLKPVSDGLLVLIILALFLSSGNPDMPGGGFFKQFSDAIGTTKTPAPSGGSSNVSVSGFNVTTPFANTNINAGLPGNWVQVGGQWVEFGGGGA